MTIHPNVAALEADLLSFTTALEELEVEIVGERAAALAAEQMAREMDEKASDLMEELREARATIAELQQENERMETEATAMEKERDEAQEGNDERFYDAKNALSDFLFENGYGSGNGYIRDPFVRRLVDAIMP